MARKLGDPLHTEVGLKEALDPVLVALEARVQAVLEQVRFRDWTFHTESQGEGTLLWCEFQALDIVSGALATQQSRRWWVSARTPRSGIVFIAWGAILSALEHEAREEFKYRGRRVAGPHMDVDEIWQIARRVDLT